MLGLVDDHGHDASDLAAQFDQVVRELDPDAEIINTEKARAKAERGAHGARHLSLTIDNTAASSSPATAPWKTPRRSKPPCCHSRHH